MADETPEPTDEEKRAAFLEEIKLEPSYENISDDDLYSLGVGIRLKLESGSATVRGLLAEADQGENPAAQTYLIATSILNLCPQFSEELEEALADSIEEP